MKNLVSPDLLTALIHEVRDRRVMLDSDLAKLYGVETRILIQAVKRNLMRFPSDFMFQLNSVEVDSLRSQFVTLKRPLRRGQHRKYLPYVFTEQGVAMLSAVLNSPRAISVNIAIMRAFVKLRQIAAGNYELGLKLKDLEKRLGAHDEQIRSIFEAIRELISPREDPEPKIGFREKAIAPYGRRVLIKGNL